MILAWTPKPIADRLINKLDEALNTPQVRERGMPLVSKVHAMLPIRFGQAVDAGSEKWLRIGRTEQIKAD
jgi:hypothetical protein